MKSLAKILWVSAFAISMGFLEAAVVVYLRRIYYYPDGFRFPLRAMDDGIVLVEIAREAATLIMLLAVGVLSGRNRAEKFAYFAYSFAIWDIFYYVFLWLCLRWPQSLFTWDILFLLPVPWVGPVVAPVIIAVTMIALALAVIRFCDKGRKTGFRKWEAALLITGSVIAVLSFTEDFLKYMGGKSAYLSGYIPGRFDWPLFLAGELLFALGCSLYCRRLMNSPAGTL